MGISNTQYRDIIFQYDQRRMKNQRLLNKRYDMLYQKYPELKEIHDKIIELSMEQAANEVLTPGQAAEKRAKHSSIGVDLPEHIEKVERVIQGIDKLD